MDTRTADIFEAASPQAIAQARALFVEYADWLKVDLCFQGFADELATLPGAYAPPLGRLLLAGDVDSAFGCIALRPLTANIGTACAGVSNDQVDVGCGIAGVSNGRVGVATAASAPTIGEVKRLYVQPANRGGGWGRRLIDALITEARAIGYRELKLDTLSFMDAARSLYARYGFVPCDAYYVNPTPGVVYMSRKL